ncbi:hypothetical protein PR202_gb11656 [Eleusine coracana subsp. coracana]|uniref:Retrotransposon gag domain-containing protein n=1 Tax=Eleusine coracana subsp. coracana TaxID=191504 RepID=A0AAV5ENY5_ELECO|nr:hypothetical protein PR202_gb11656 [Eleusine coracana subsp. coracana]
MIEAQDDLNTFKAAHLPIEGNWDEIFIEYGGQDDVEIALAGIDDVEMMDLEEPEEPMEPEGPKEPEDLVQDMVRTRNQDDPESSQQGAHAEPSLAEVLAAALNRQQNDSEILCWLVDITSHLAGREATITTTISPDRAITQIFWVPIHQPSSVPESRWTSTTGCVRPSLNSVCWNALSTRRCYSPPNNSRALLAPEEVPGIHGSKTRRVRAHFIPAGLMQRKFQEFMDLKQGGRNVLQYSEAFNHLAQYATKYVNTEEKKRYAFLRGMNATLKERLTWQTTGTYNDLVNAAIVQEGAMRQVEEEDRKRKAPASATAAPQAKHRLIYTSPT